MSLTARQQEILEFIDASQQAGGVVPSTREIQHHFGFASQTAAINHLRALEKKGVIHRLAGKARAVMLTTTLRRDPIIDIPIYGAIIAGMAEASEQEDQGFISLDTRSAGLSRKAKVFALKVKGDSMTGAQISEGDLVILEIREPRNHDIVAALIDGETTLKRFTIEKGRPFLKAENPNYPDLIPITELVIQGVMVALIRRCREG